MASAVAGQVLGPRPGMAIVSFSQGIVEICLRLAAVVVGSVPALTAAAVALATSRTDDIDAAANASSELSDTRDPDTYAATGCTIGVAGLAIIVQILMIVIRFLNVGLINWKIVIFLVIDIILSVFFAVGHAAAGVVMALFAADWDDFADSASGSVDDKIERIRNAMAVGAGFSFVATILFAFLALWMLLFMIKKWNEKVVKYTIKEAVTS